MYSETCGVMLTVVVRPVACNCHNHSSVCVYNETVATMTKSLDIHGNYSGGGVCQECKVRQ